MTLLGQNVNSYGRDLQLRGPPGAATPTLGCARCSPTCSRAVGAVDGIRRVRFTSPHPKDMRPETFAAMADTPAGVRAPPLPAAVGQRPRAGARCTAATPPSATSSGSPRPAARSPDLAVSTDIIVGFPGETDDDFERTLEVAAAAEYDYAYTFIFSPRPGTEAATMTDRFVDPAVAGERFQRLQVVVERSALGASTRRAIGRVEEVLVEGPTQEGPDA